MQSDDSRNTTLAPLSEFDPSQSNPQAGFLLKDTQTLVDSTSAGVQSAHHPHQPTRLEERDRDKDGESDADEERQSDQENSDDKSVFSDDAKDENVLDDEEFWDDDDVEAELNEFRDDDDDDDDDDPFEFYQDDEKDENY